MNDWQTWAAGAVVLLTLVLLLRGAYRRRKGCGGNCDCGTKKNSR